MSEGQTRGMREDKTTGMREGEPVVAASYNIHRCIGRDGEKNVPRVGEVLTSLDFDVVGLQEVESGDGPGAPAVQLQRLAEVTASVAVAGPTIVGKDADYGNALLVRGQVLDVSRHDLSVPRREPRGVLEARVRLGGSVLRCLTTHLGLGIAERHRQMRQLLEIVCADTTHPTALFGDFNEWFPWARSRALLTSQFGRVPMLATFPARWPLLALDHVWVRPRSALSWVGVYESRLSRVASDHLPVVARLVL